MKLLSKLLSRQPTPKTGTAIIQDAVAKTLGIGKRGFVIAALSEPDSRAAEIVIGIKGDLQEGLYRVLQKLLSKPETKQEATGAMLMALAQSSSAQVVITDADVYCGCPICTLRRETDDQRERTTTH